MENEVTEGNVENDLIESSQEEQETQFESNEDEQTNDFDRFEISSMMKLLNKNSFEENDLTDFNELNKETEEILKESSCIKFRYVFI